MILQGHALELVPELKKARSTKIVVCDMYDPMHLELLEQGKDDTDEQRELDLIGVTKVLNTQLERGDFFLCASERQRHFWLGHLTALGRLTPGAVRQRPDGPLAARGRAVRPAGQAAAADRLADQGRARATSRRRTRSCIWAGGVYSWFDPLTLVHAIDLLARRHADVAAGVPRHEAPEPRGAGDGHRRPDPRAVRTGSG